MMEMSFLVVAAATIMLTGCVTSGPTDLRLISIGEVNRATEKQIPGFYGKNGSYIRPDEPALKVIFASHTNLIEYAKNDMQIVVHADFCNEAFRPPDPAGQWFGFSWLSVYSENTNISELPRGALKYLLREEPILNIQENGEMYYHMYVMSYRRADRGYPNEKLFDLTLHPQDVCIKTSISDFLSRRDSNTMNIPADLIKEALQ